MSASQWAVLKRRRHCRRIENLGNPREDLFCRHLVDRRSVYLDAGAGFRLHFDYGGVQQGLVGLDVAVPLSRTVLDWVPDCKTQDNGVKRCFASLGVFLTFDQTF